MLLTRKRPWTRVIKIQKKILSKLIDMPVDKIPRLRRFPQHTFFSRTIVNLRKYIVFLIIGKYYNINIYITFIFIVELSLAEQHTMDDHFTIAHLYLSTIIKY